MASKSGPPLRRHLPRSRRDRNRQPRARLFVNTQLDPGKQADSARSSGNPTLAGMILTAQTRRSHQASRQPHVAVTSTLPVFESSIPQHLHLPESGPRSDVPPTREAYLYTRNLELTRPANPARALAYQHNAQLEHKFVAAGGLLLGRSRPNRRRRVLPGFGDQREVELLVDSDGFTPLEPSGSPRSTARSISAGRRPSAPSHPEKKR